MKVGIYVLLSVLSVGCADYGALPLTEIQLGYVQAAEDAWSPMPVRAACNGAATGLYLATGSDAWVNDRCGGDVFACVVIGDGVVVMRESFLGTPSEATLLVHEAVHVLADCNIGTANSSHSRQDLWVMPGRCLSDSVEGRARVLLGVDGCDTYPGSNCC